MSDSHASTDPQQKRAYSTPKTVVLGNVRDLTLSGGSQISDSKAGNRAMATM